DTNEMTDPNGAGLRAVDGIDPTDLGFKDALRGGVTSALIKPGSGNPIGGRTAIVKTWGRIVDEMLVTANLFVKSALGENPKRVYGEKSTPPRRGWAPRRSSATPSSTPGTTRPNAPTPRPRAPRSTVTWSRRPWPTSSTASSHGTSTATAPTTSPRPSAWPRNSDTAWSSTTAPKAIRSPTTSPRRAST